MQYVKVRHRIAREGTKELAKTWIYFFYLGARRAGWSTPRSDRFYSCERELAAILQEDRSGNVRKISLSPGFDPVF
jgi:hypothetical protein